MFGEISIFLELSNHIWFEKLVSIKDKQLSFLFIQITIVETLSTKSSDASLTCNIQQASLRNSKEVIAALANDRPIEYVKMLISAFVILVWSFTALKLGFIFHKLLEMRESLLES